MDFQALQDPLFGDEESPAADVDLASVVWGQSSANAGSGDIVDFDGMKWVAAVAIKDDDPNGQGPYVRFLSQDYQVMSAEFAVTNSGTIAKWCRLARVDCTYLGDDSVQVYVAYRLGADQYDPPSLYGWDVKVAHMDFSYNSSSGWVLNGQTEMSL